MMKDIGRAGDARHTRFAAAQAMALAWDQDKMPQPRTASSCHSALILQHLLPSAVCISHVIVTKHLPV